MATLAAAQDAASEPSDAPLSPRRRLILTIAVMAATMMQILDTTIANVAIPHMQTSLGATMDSVNWVLTSYIIASAIAIPITGWAADRIGQRQLFLWSMVGFVGSSMLCGSAQSLEQMVLFRFIQGVTAASLGPLSQAVMLDINPPERQGKAMAIWGMGIMLGPILGPVLGGWLTDNANWRWVFFVNLPIGLVAFTVLFALLPHRPRRARRLDLFGFTTLAVALAALQLMLDRGAHLDWFESLEVRIEAAVFVAAAWMFGVHLATSRDALFDRRVLGDRNLIAGLFFMFVIGIVMFASMALLPPMLQRLFGYPVVDTGLIVAVRGMGIIVSMAIVGRIMAHVDGRWLVATGFAIAAFSLWQMSHWSLMMGTRTIVLSGLIQGLGMGLVFIPLNTMAFATLAAADRTDGASLLNLTRNLGASVGISVVTTLLTRNLQVARSDMVGHVTGAEMNVIDPGQAARWGSWGDSALAAADAMINRQAAMIAYIDDFRFMMWVTIAAIPLVVFMRPPTPGTAAPPMGE